MNYDRERLEQMLGKSLPSSRKFLDMGTFAAHRAAVEFCAARGYSVGRMCGPEPIGIKRGPDWNIQKWKNMDSSTWKQLDGVLVGDMRNGPVTVYFEAPALEQLAECAE
jgi:hypothetical protein